MLRSKLKSFLCLSASFSKQIKINNTARLTYATTSSTNQVQHWKKDEEKYSTRDKIESEREYLVRMQSDPDRFGGETVETNIDEDDMKEEEFLANPPTHSHHLSTKQYADIIKSYIRHRKIKEAIDVIEVRMLKEDKVKPDGYLYNLVLGACGRVGYTKKAFSLYNEMKRRDLKITPGTYTALFNACSNSPWLDDGLSRARHLLDIIIEKRYQPNDTNYNAMIKAFGRCGDLKTAFSLVDEMIQKGISVKDDTINFLLHGCITDKETGFRHAILVWRKMLEKSIAPSSYTYNLMLKCIRECGLGDLNATKDVIEKMLPPTDKFLLQSGDNNQINSESLLLNAEDNLNAEITNYNPDQSSTKDCQSLELNLPNLLANIPHLGNIISLAEVTRPQDRLLVVGGATGFLQNMVDNNCNPDLKTFTQLLECSPNSKALEEELFAAMKKADLKPDVDFYNMLIKRRSLRCDYEGARDVLELLHERRYKPDLITYGVLALGCKTREDAESLIGMMRQANYRLNIEILGAMMKQACFHMNFRYVIFLMNLCVQENISPNQKFMEHLLLFKKRCKDISNRKNDPLSRKVAFQKGHHAFRTCYKTFVEKVSIATEDDHPWQQFRQTTETNTKHYKDKSARFKARHASLFRQKTSKKHTSKRKIVK